MGWKEVRRRGDLIVLTNDRKGDLDPLAVQLVDGSFDRENLLETLAAQGLDVEAFEQQLKRR